MRNFKGLSLIMFLALVVILFLQFGKSLKTEGRISYSEFERLVKEKNIERVVVKGNNIQGTFVSGYKEGGTFRTVGPSSQGDIAEFLRSNGVKSYEFQEPEGESFFQQLIVSFLPVLVLVLIFFFFLRQIQAGGGKAMSFGKSKARLHNENQRKVTFQDVAGIEEAKEELEEIIDFLKEPKKYTRLGGRIPKGVLLMGAPGTGKTLLAKAIAGEAGVSFFSISGSDFVEMFVGVGASRVRDLFEQGRKNAPCIIFIDEIDAVGRHRGAGIGGGHDEREQTLNQLLVEMDGFDSKEGLILIAATNRPDILDPALLRTGRFDRRVVVPKPDVRGRESILKVHTRKIPLNSDVDLEVLAKSTPGFTGADLESMCNEAALLAARLNKDKIDMEDFERAKDKVLMGAERKSLILSEKERKTTAYHEAGHVLVAKLIPGSDPVHKVTIIPRGLALGVTQQLPQEERFTVSKQNALNEITVLMGGRAAEEIVFKEQTTGAGNDIERATEIARKMVCKWGMSERLGPLTYGKKDEQVFLGKELGFHQDYSEKTAQLIDEEVGHIVQDCYGRARELLSAKVETLRLIAETLLEHEVLDAEEIDRLCRGEKILKQGPVRAKGKDGKEPEGTTKDTPSTSGQDAASV